MMIKSLLQSTLLAATALSPAAFAANIQANACQIFVKQVWAAPSSHGSAQLGAVVKVNFLGNGEYIQRVAFSGVLNARDLGNDPNYCHSSTDSRANGQQQAFDPSPYTDGIGPGEYIFYFPILTGSVINQCPGYEYNTVGTFFVETNKNTYWLNPQNDATQSFDLDYNGYHRLPTYQRASTLRDDLRYYNPAGCQ